MQKILFMLILLFFGVKLLMLLSWACSMIASEYKSVSCREPVIKHSDRQGEDYV